MTRKIRRVWLCILLFPIVLMMYAGCISVPFEVAGDLIEATGDVVETVVEVPVDVTTSLLEIPSSYQSKYVERQNFEFPYRDVRRLDLNEHNGWVKIYGSDQDYIRVEAEKEIHARNESSAKNYADRLEIVCAQSSDTLRVYRRPSRDPDWVRVQINYTVYLPVNMDLNLVTHNGSVEICDLWGDIRVESHNGRMVINRCAGRFFVVSHNGELSLEQCQVERPSEFTTHNGSQKIRLDELSASLMINSQNGPIRLKLPPIVNAHLEVESGNGDIHFDLPVRVSRSSRSRLIGSLGNGGEAKITIHSQNGSVTLSEWD